MALTPKRLKCGKDLIEMQSEDRISALPSNISSHILSLLPTKYAVATSVLSTKWNDSWTEITRLDFCDTMMQDIENRTSMEADFINFVYRVLLLSTGSCLDEFRLTCDQMYDPSHINAWVVAVLRREVKEISISVRANNPSVLPRKLFTCKTVVSLELGERFSLNIPYSVCFPCLKELCLYIVKLTDNDSITRLLTGCPTLEKLIMIECIGEGVDVVHISVSSLKWLELSILGYEEDTSASEFRIVLDTPLLHDLKIIDCIAQGYEFRHVPELVDAHINVTLQFDTVGPFNDAYLKALNDLLKGVSKVHNLELEAEACLFGNCELPAFRNLKELELGTRGDSTYKQLPKLLERSPLLETLTITEGLGHHEDSLGEILEWEQPPKEVPKCLLHHLKTIKIKDFRGVEAEMVLVGYFLKAAKVLEKLVIVTELEEEPVVVFNKLLALPRASRLCQIEIL